LDWRKECFHRSFVLCDWWCFSFGLFCNPSVRQIHRTKSWRPSGAVLDQEEEFLKMPFQQPYQIVQQIKSVSNNLAMQMLLTYNENCKAPSHSKQAVETFLSVTRLFCNYLHFHTCHVSILPIKRLCLSFVIWTLVWVVRLALQQLRTIVTISTSIVFHRMRKHTSPGIIHHFLDPQTVSSYQTAGL